ncbi:kinase-like domain-containing protein [Scleroderma citrinum]
MEVAALLRGSSPDHSINHSEHGYEQAVVNPLNGTSCTPTVNCPTKEIPSISFLGALVAVFQRVCHRLVRKLSSLAKIFLGPKDGLDTLLLRAARYSNNLNDTIDHDHYHLSINTGNSTIYQGVLHPSETRIAIKTVRWFGADSDAVKRTLREVHVWSKLRHDNVLPLVGITTIPNHMVSIVTEWMPRGNAHDYVQDVNVDPRPLIVGISRGLFYLHTHVSGPIVHGDLKGMNVLISMEGQALLTDFGHSHLANSSFSMTVDPPRGGSWNWLAPENVESELYSITLPGDVWAFGMTALELFSRRKPYHDASNVPSILLRILRGPPGRPNDECTNCRMTDAWWDVCNMCWERDISLRPEIPVLKTMIEQLANSEIQ